MMIARTSTQTQRLTSSTLCLAVATMTTILSRCLRTTALTFSIALLAACTNPAGGADDSAAPSAPQSVATADGPCALLTDAEVRRVFPEAGDGVRNREAEQMGMVSCQWDTSRGGLALWVNPVDALSVEDEAHGRMVGIVEPGNPAADAAVRYEVVAGLGDAAIAVVERGDAAKGILQDSALLVVRRHGKQIAITSISTGLARRDRAAALADLERLGRAAAGRL